MVHVIAFFVSKCLESEQWIRTQWWLNPYLSQGHPALLIGAYVSLYTGSFIAAAGAILKLIVNSPELNLSYKTK